jgi:Nif-specific regulatory protein
MTVALAALENDGQVAVAQHIRRLARERWGDERVTVIIGLHPRLNEALEKVMRVGAADSPVLLTGETGTGKELFARAVYLLSDRRDRPFLSVNCAHFQEGQLIASELFGHRKGSFTGAISDHRGVFEEANGGLVFLDEVGELSLTAQAMLLRVLSEKEIVPVGCSHARRVNVRVIAATTRDLRAMVRDGRFREDLFFRLRCIGIHIPSVRERGSDWELIAAYYLNQLCRSQPATKTFSAPALELLRTYPWPGNVREIKSLVDTGYFLSGGAVIEPCDFAEALEVFSRQTQLDQVPLLSEITRRYQRMTEGGESFWDVVHRPYMARLLSHHEAREIVLRGLETTRGSYKKLLGIFNIESPEYLKFMDFLRHQRLKPDP